ncbi:hypothetical protein GCM10017714_09840 [Curtobacterium pusillum]|uniref:Uncharacterized protein n=1 Tax=Curtobacterium pusillum TaxID=69373 RepID=A0ABX2M3R2_9MICO|nr:hypothetical protein [Curtobacterium pusillum]NUU12780.1 hypothetical protein [Curtobacterium pusillum]GLK30246.1 hypothetical protein GCM10017610_05310 [Curtobacterium pusillum]
MTEEWWAPKPIVPRPAVVLPVPLDAVPALVEQAVHAVPGAAVMEVRPDGAVIGRRTSFALRAENIVLAFRSEGPASSRVEIIREGRDGLSYGQVLWVTPMARAILRELAAATAAA